MKLLNQHIERIKSVKPVDIHSKNKNVYVTTPATPLVQSTHLTIHAIPQVLPQLYIYTVTVMSWI